MFRNKLVSKRKFIIYDDYEIISNCPNSNNQIGGIYCRNKCPFFKKMKVCKRKKYGIVYCLWSKVKKSKFYAVDINGKVFESMVKPKKAFAESYYDYPKNYSFPAELTDAALDRIALEIEITGKPLNSEDFKFK